MPGTEEPSLFIPDADFAASTNARGVLRLRIRPGAPERAFRVYFDIVENGEKPMVAYGDELREANWLSNGSFERADREGKSPAIWDLPKRSGATLDNLVAHKGTRSIRLHSPEDGQVASLAIPGTAPLRVEQGDRFAFSFWAKGQNLRDQPMLVSLYWYDASKKYLSHEKLDYIGDATWDWRVFTGSIAAPADAKGLRIYVATYSTTGGLWIDDVTMASLNPPELKNVQIANPPVPAETPLEPANELPQQ